ncbi:calcium/sodium antiporter [Lutibacter sp. B2]|nr:calcium/sodium antiporter [Lutibacter sp. B2]
MAYILLLLGFIFLIKGAGYFVEGASSIAKILRVPPILIGLTIVAFGTSAPEGAVSIQAAIKGNNGMAMGNIIGSNMFNMSLVIGIAAMIYPLKVEMETIRKEIPFVLLASILLEILIMDQFIEKRSIDILSRADGFVLMCFFIIFLYYLYEVARKSREKISEVDENEKYSTGKSILFTIGGLAGIIIGGEIVVRNSMQIAKAFGLSDTLIGMTIVSLGTSLPELSTCVTATLKKQSDIAIGNIVGSNIFNTLFVLGTSSIISPLALEGKMFIDVMFMIVYTFILLIFSILHQKIVRWEGAVLVLSYVIYLIYVIMNK